jgi:hypothetical protein
MLVILSTPDSNRIRLNINKVRVHLRTGIVEIFNQHQDLLGKIENDLVELESNFENKLEKSFFILQDAVFIVSNKGLDSTSEYQGTTVYIHAKNIREFNSSFSIDDLSKEYEGKKLELERENQKLVDSNDKIFKSKISMLQDDVEFLAKSLLKGKELKELKL